MEHFDQRLPAAAPGSPLARVACAVAAGVVVTSAGAVVALRVANPGREPEGQNWWLVAWTLVSLAFSVTGVALASGACRRLLGAAFFISGIGAALTAVATQYAGYRLAHGADVEAWLADAVSWSRPLAAGVLVAVVPWLLAPMAPVVLVRAVVVATVAAVVVASIASNADWPRAVGSISGWAVVASAAVGVSRLGIRWWRSRGIGTDPLPGWIFAGAVAALVAVVPTVVEVTGWSLPGRDVVFAVLLCATVPLLVGGTIVDAVRDRATPFLGISHHVLEWAILAAGIVAIYTAVVAGLGRAVGGAAPSWYLIAATGTVALVLEPARRRLRNLVDRLAYGARDEPLTVVQRVVDHLGADAGDDLLPRLAENLRHELCLDAVGIDLRVEGGWRRGAWAGPDVAHHRIVELRHSGAVVGLLVVGWCDGPALRRRDAEVLAQLVGPLSLAVGWVRLTEDLRRSGLAVVSAREEERRRLRRDLHDGLGPSLTGVSLGLRTVLGDATGSDAASAPERPELLERMADEVDAVVVELKRIVRDLRPTALDQLGLVGALEEFCRRFDGALRITAALPCEPISLPAAVEVAAYRIATEAVTNVVRHAGAERCWLTVDVGRTVTIDVVDDGVGLAAGGPPGVGLTAMRERAAELGGTVTVAPNASRGTRVHVQLPATLP